MPGAPSSPVARRAILELGYNAVSARWRALFGKSSRKVPLDAGFSCPNRDGVLSRGGCAFCNAQGAGTGLSGLGLSLTGQWEHWRAHRRERWGDVALVAYLQSFSNTHGSPGRLAEVLGELASLPDLAGLCLATRPDCLDTEKLALLAAFPSRELWLELGLQSANPATLARLNRGHGVECFARAVRLAAGLGLKVCAHVMAGLPGEGLADFLATVELINALPVAGIKFHNYYVALGSPLADEYAAGAFVPLGLDDYLEHLLPALALLRPDIVVHRLSADPDKDELLAPEWAGKKRVVHNAIKEALRREGVRQGMAWEGRAGPGSRDGRFAFVTVKESA